MASAYAADLDSRPPDASKSFICQPHAKRSGAWQPWAWCNLGRNPFGEMTREERVCLAVVDVEPIVAQTRHPRSAIQLIGDAGRGKTTHLLSLHHHLPDSAYVYLPEDSPCPAIPMGNPLLIDEAQRLPRAVRRAVIRSGVPLVLATHRDLASELRRGGYQIITHRIGARLDPRRLRELLNRRVRWCRLGDGPVPELSLADAHDLVARFGSDIRGIEDFLYDRVQQQAYSDGEMRFVDRVG